MKKTISAVLSMIMALLIILPISVSASGSTAFTVQSVTGEPGTTVNVPITVENNPGILGTTLQITYDEGITLTNATNGEAFSVLALTKPRTYASPCKFVWDEVDIDPKDVKDGEIIVLTFQIDENAAPGKVYNITMSYKKNDIVDRDLSEVNVALNNGKISIPSPQAVSIAAENIGVFYADDNYTGESTVATAFKANIENVNGTISFTVTPENEATRTFDGVTQITNTNVVLGIIVSGLNDANAIGEVTIK